MIKKYLIIAVLILSGQLGFAQKSQRLAYIDMAFVLEKIPEYVEAQGQLDAKVKSWEKRLKREKNEIESIKRDFSNEKALLTPELVQEREDDIYFKEQEYQQLQEAYFGPKGDLYLYRKLLVQPIQDKVYNAIQDIAVKKRYDLVFDKSSDLIMLYTNSRYDISDLVVNVIVRDQKQAAMKARRDKLNKRKANNKVKATSKQKVKKPFRLFGKKKSAKKPIVSNVKKYATQNTSGKATDSIVAVEDIVQPKDSVGAVESKIDQNETPVLKDTPSDKILKRIQARNAKRKLLLEKIRKANEAKSKNREDARKAAAKKRAERLKQLDLYKKELVRKRDSAKQASQQKKANKKGK